MTNEIQRKIKTEMNWREASMPNSPGKVVKIDFGEATPIVY